MASVPVSKPSPQLVESLEQRLRRLEAVWRSETGHLSSSTAIINHAAFQEIIALGQGVVPLLLLDLAKGPSLWVWALPSITGANPVPPEDRGRIDRMGEAWLAWGKANGYSC